MFGYYSYNNGSVSRKFNNKTPSYDQLEATYGLVWQTGDVIEIVVDKEKGHLKYIHNDKDLGWAFENNSFIKKNQMYFFVSDLNSCLEEEIEIIS